MAYPEGSSGFLPDLRVLDLTDNEVGFSGRILAELGSSVVRIDKLTLPEVIKRQVHPGSVSENRFLHSGKKRITLDIKSDSGRKIFRQLAYRYDVIIETFPPGYLDSLELGFSTLSANHHKLIMVSATPFGQTGPRSHWKANNLVISALSGQHHVTGESTGEPLGLYGEQTYLVASLFVVNAVLIALQYRRKTGRGQHADISLQECAVAVLDQVLPRYLSDGVVSFRQGAMNWNSDFHIVPCREGNILLSLEQWDVLVAWMERDGKAGDLISTSWCEPEFRSRHLNHVLEIIKEWAKTYSADELFEQALLLRLPWAMVALPRDIAANPQLAARRFFEQARILSGESFLIPRALPWSEANTPVLRIAEKGEDNETIYGKELGITSAQLDLLKSEGVI